MLREGPGQYIVLAVLVPDRKVFADAVIASKIDSDSRLFAGGKEWKPITHFPPSSTDPYLRVVFPRRVEQKAKSLEFTVYVPGVTDPYRRLLFPINKMTYRGRVEY